MKEPAGSTTEDAQSILRAAVADASETEIWPVSATTSNFVYQTSDGSIVRFPHNDWVSDGFFRERKLLKQVQTKDDEDEEDEEEKDVGARVEWKCAWDNALEWLCTATPLGKITKS